MNRRQTLAALGTTALTWVSGCATLEAELGMRTDTLGAVTLANSLPESVEVSLEILRDGNRVHQASYQLDSGSERERPQYTINEWGENPNAQRWAVRAKTPQSEWKDATIDAATGSENECYSVTVVTDERPESLLVLLGGCKPHNR